MKDEQVRNELWLNCFTNQLDGYSFGDPNRGKSFSPVVPCFYNVDGSVNREKTLDLPVFTFTDEQKIKLLEK